MRFIPVAGAAALILAAAPALAQTSSPSDPSTSSAPSTSSTPTASDPGAASDPSTAGTSTAPATSALSVGQPVKDKTGAVIGEVADLKSDASGSQAATIKMGEQTFVIGAESLVVQNGAAVINATATELKAMIAKAGAAG